VAQLEDDLRRLLTGQPAAHERRARRAAAYLAAHEADLRERGLLSFGEKLGDLHLAPALEDALAAWLDDTS